MIGLRYLGAVALTALAMLSVFAVPSHAQDRDLPYWATLRFNEVNMRVGPSREYKIDWVYKREGLPVKVLRLREGWRYIEDHEGTRGWVASSQLSPRLGVMIIGDGVAEMRANREVGAPVNWRAQPGVVGDLMRCDGGLCEIDVDGRSGWVTMDRLWGVGQMDPVTP